MHVVTQNYVLLWDCAASSDDLSRIFPKCRRCVKVHFTMTNRKEIVPLKVEDRVAVVIFQEKLLLSAALTLSNAEEYYSLDTDAANVQDWRGLMQKEPNKTYKPADFWQWSLVQPEKARNTTQRICFVIIWSTFLLRACIKGGRISLWESHILIWGI